MLLVIAVGGAALFGNADSFAELLIGRAMIGLGVAGAFMAGFKAIVIWFPRDRRAFVNGWMIMLGSLGADHGYRADGLAGQLDWLAKPVRNPDDRDAWDRSVDLFCRA